MKEEKEDQIYRALSFLEEKREEMLKLLEKMVNIESGNENKPGCDAMCALMEEQLRNIGAKTRTVSMDTRGDFLHGVWGEENEAPPVLFSGHMDTVFPAGTLERNPFRIEDGKIYGPGCLDMKSGLVIALYAVQALKTAGYDKRSIRFAFSGDEENGHRESRASEEYRQAVRGCAAVLNFETGYPDDGIVVGRKGSCRFTIEVTGIASHAGNAPEKGRSAILEMAHKIIELQELNAPEYGTTLNIGIISGGTAVNSVPDRCLAKADVRFSEREGLDALLKRLTEKCSIPVVEGTKTQISISSVNDVMDTTPEILELFNHIKETAKKIGYPGELHPIRVGGWSDASLAAAQGVPVVCGMGACGEFNHTEREYAIADSLLARAKLAAAAIITFNV